MGKNIKPTNAELMAHLTLVVTELDEFNDDSQNALEYDDAVSGSNLLIDLFRRNYKKGRILDIGCGSGGLFMQLPQISDGIDPNTRRFNNASKKRGVKTVQGFSENLPYRYEQFDTIVSWGTFCFVRSLIESLAEANRVLKKGGVFIFDMVTDTVLPIAQTVNPGHFTNKYLPLFGFEVVEKREFAEPENHLRLGIVVRKLSDFDYRNFLLPQIVDGKLINYKQDRDWFLT